MSVERVRDTLFEYAQRGVFRGFDHRDGDEGAEFRFSWLLRRPFRVTYDRSGPTLALEGLLPEADEWPDVRSDLEGLLEDRVEGGLPAHRAVDPDRAAVELRSRDDGGLDLVLHVRRDAHEYGTRKLLNLAHEIWVRLNDAHQRYLWEAQGAPME